MYKENFPERMKKARTDAGYTQPQVSKELNISKGTISKYETGKLEPDIEKLGMLAEFYNVSVDWLIGLVLQEPPKPKPKFIDKAIVATKLYGFLITLPMKDKLLFLSGQMGFSQFLESDYFKKATPDQQLYMLQEYERQQWVKERDEWVKQLKKDGHWNQESFIA